MLVNTLYSYFSLLQNLYSGQKNLHFNRFSDNTSFLWLSVANIHATQINISYILHVHFFLRLNFHLIHENIIRKISVNVTSLCVSGVRTWLYVDKTEIKAVYEI